MYVGKKKMCTEELHVPVDIFFAQIANIAVKVSFQAPEGHDAQFVMGELR